MAGAINKKIGVISMVRNDTVFVKKWIDYYGKEFGCENMFLIFDGHDQEIPEYCKKINTIKVPHIKLSRAGGDRNRARLISKIAQGLFFRFDIIIASDIDEFLVVDPKLGISLKDYLSKINRTSVSGLGLDVGQHLKKEAPINLNKPFLEQRSFAHVSSRYTKPVVATKPITWGSGFHRVKGKNFNIDANLYLFHFGMVDYELSTGTVNDPSRLEQGWGGHLDRRQNLFNLITNSKPIEGDSYFKKARQKQTLFRPIYAINKPGMIKGNPIIKIPKRFKKTV